MNRFALLVPLALVPLVLAPLAAAQTSPEIRFYMESAHDTMPLPETGKRSHSITVKADVKDFVCAQEAVIFISTSLKNFEKWAGASLNPREVRLTIDQGQPGASQVKLDGQFITLEVAWDLEGRADVGAAWQYEVEFDESSFKFDSGGPCLPNQSLVFGDPIKVTATMPDIVANETALPADCATAPDLPECNTAAPTAEGNSPGFEPLFLLASLLGAAWTLRRRTH